MLFPEDFIWVKEQCKKVGTLMDEKLRSSNTNKQDNLEFISKWEHPTA